MELRDICRAKPNGCDKSECLSICMESKNVWNACEYAENSRNCGRLYGDIRATNDPGDGNGFCYSLGNIEFLCIRK